MRSKNAFHLYINSKTRHPPSVSSSSLFFRASTVALDLGHRIILAFAPPGRSRHEMLKMVYSTVTNQDGSLWILKLIGRFTVSLAVSWEHKSWLLQSTELLADAIPFLLCQRLTNDSSSSIVLPPMRISTDHYFMLPPWMNVELPHGCHCGSAKP